MWSQFSNLFYFVKKENVKKTNIKFGVFYTFSFFNLLILVSLLLCVDLLAKFIFNFCFVFPVSWEGLNCHPDDRNLPEIPNGEIPELKRKKNVF